MERSELEKYFGPGWRDRLPGCKEAPAVVSSRRFRFTERTLEHLTRSDFSSFSKVLRLKNYLLGRANSIEKYYIKILNKCEEFRDLVEEECYTIRALAGQLDINSVVSHTGEAGVDFCTAFKPFDLSAVRLTFTYERIFRLSKVFPRKFSDHCIFLFGRYEAPIKYVRKPSPFGNYLKRLSDNSRFGRKQELLARLDLELKERKDWYLVFNSLTVRSGSEAAVFSAESGVWKDYIQKCDRIFGINSYGSWRSALSARAEGKEFHTYFAVVERGSLRGRLHIHVLHIFKDLPSNFSDPNRGSRVPYRRQIEAMRSLWDYGFSAPVAVRFSSCDAYSRKGWLWPVKAELGIMQPLKVSSPGAIISYIGKYLTKAYSLEASLWRSDQKKMWRSRLSRNLGVSQVRRCVEKMTHLEVQAMIVVRTMPPVPGLKIPRRLLRLNLVLRFLRSLIRLARVCLSRFLRDLVSPRNIQERFLVLIGVLRLHSPPRCGITRMSGSCVMAAFDRGFSMLREACFSSYLNFNVRGASFSFAR